jgi:hypothetical protein
MIPRSDAPRDHAQDLANSFRSLHARRWQVGARCSTAGLRVTGENAGGARECRQAGRCREVVMVLLSSLPSLGASGRVPDRPRGRRWCLGLARRRPGGSPGRHALPDGAVGPPEG